GKRIVPANRSSHKKSRGLRRERPVDTCWPDAQTTSDIDWTDPLSPQRRDLSSPCPYCSFPTLVFPLGFLFGDPFALTFEHISLSKEAIAPTTANVKRPVALLVSPSFSMQRSAFLALTRSAIPWRCWVDRHNPPGICRRSETLSTSTYCRINN